MAEGDVRNDRLKKLKLVTDAGMEAFPSHTARTTTVADFVAEFEHVLARGEEVVLAGRLMSRRGQGGIMFADLFDGSRTQLVFQKTEMDEQNFTLFAEGVDIGDFVEARGVAYLTKRGEKSLNVRTWTMLSKSLAPIPSEWYGVKDEELKLRERYLDILMNEEVRDMFVRRSKFWQSIREFYLARNFLEVETPILENTPGGADARPFVSHHNALDMQVYLRISTGELWQKRLLVAGYPKVFEIGRIFRNEGQSREHLQDYTQLESYEAFSDMKAGMAFIQDLYRHIVKEVYGKFTFEINGHSVDFAEEWKTVDFCESIAERFGVHPLTCSESEAVQAARDAKVLSDADNNKARAIDALWKSIRKSISGPAFLVGVPVYLEPLAKRSKENPLVVERFQVLIAGSEVGKGFSELNDPLDQRGRFEAQQALRDAGDDEAQRLDEEYVHAMEYGMPPAFGFGMSERFFAFLENKPAHETQLFPLLRPKDVVAKTEKETKVCAVVLNKELLDSPWKELNTTAHLAASFAARIGEKLFLKDAVETKDGKKILMNIQHAIMIRVANNVSDLRNFMSTVQDDMIVVPFTEEMLKTSDDKKVAKITATIDSSDVRYLGILLFGKKSVVDALTAQYPLHA